MLSSDKNVETIAQLLTVLKHYLGLQKEYLKLDVIDKVVRLLTVAALFVLFFLLAIAVSMFLSFAFAFWLGQHIGLAPSFLVVGGGHLLLLLFFVMFRRKLIERPLVRFLANLLLNSE